MTAPLSTGAGAPSDEATAAIREAASLFEGVYARLACHRAGQRSEPRAIPGGRAAAPGGD